MTSLRNQFEARLIVGANAYAEFLCQYPAIREPMEIAYKRMISNGIPVDVAGACRDDFVKHNLTSGGAELSEAASQFKRELVNAMRIKGGSQ